MEIKGNFRRSIYSGDNGYTVGLFRLKDSIEDIPSTITFTGYFHDLNMDDTYIFRGDFVEHSKYGLQFQVESYEIVLPEEKDSIVEFLSGGLFKGIGEKTAEKIVNNLGKETLNIILDNPSNLYLIPGITKKQIDILHNTLLNYQSSYEVIVKLGELGFSTRDSLVIYNRYKDRTNKVLDDNIYSICYDIMDISFNKIDSIALKSGMGNSDIRRIEAAIIYSMNEVCNTIGHTYLTIEEIYNYSSRSINMNIDVEIFKNALNNLMLDIKIIMKDNKYYLREMYEAEENIAKRLGYLMRKEDNTNKKLDNYINAIEKEYGCFYNEKQLDAIKKSFTKNILIITGGPGTGKTTIIKGIVELYRDINKVPSYKIGEEVALLAPTGRASKRIAESTNVPASTIHRFLKWNKDLDKFAVNEHNKSDVKMVIIDEASMVDTYLFDSLLKGLKYDTKIIIVGDYNQLPSVGAGQILKDMIESDCINTVKLTELYRQEGDSSIINLAYQVNDNELDISVFDNKDDLVFYNEDSNTVMNRIVEISNMYKDNPSYQVLAPMYKTYNGIDRINVSLQNIFNEKDKSKKEIMINNILYRENDKVIQLTNMPDDNVFNGDIGYIDEIINGTKKEIVIDFDGNKVRYTASNFNKFKHAYAISIHKSQGSEFDYVLIPILKEYGKMLYRKLIYTGITRCKKKLILVGDLRALSIAINNDDTNIRKTTLKDMLKENIIV